MLEWHSNVHWVVIVLHGVKQSHHLHADAADRGAMAFPTGDRSTQMLYQIKLPSMYTFRSLEHVATLESVGCCLKIGHRVIQKGKNNFDLAGKDNRLFEIGSEKKLIRVLPQ